jgi:voltage-dependent calcium channel T type alpha-1H
VPNNAPIRAILFVVYILITSFFVMNLFVSVIVDKFNEEIKKKEGSHNFTEEQKEWVKMQRIMLTVETKLVPIVPINKFRKFCFMIVENKKFEIFIVMMIAFNTIILIMPFDGATEEYNNVLAIINNAFVVIFVIEAAFKLFAYGPKFYFHEKWNRFDICVVIISLLSVDANMLAFNFTVLRIIRVARLLRMIKASKGIRHLLKTLYLALGNIINVATLLFLIYFSFACAGMFLFGDMKFGENINANANFTSFYLALITLIRTSTGENWNYIMGDTYD